MGKAKPVKLDHLEFPKQGDALAHFREILNRYEPPAPLSEPDLIDVTALLNGHPDAARKIGSGIRTIVVDHDDQGGQCFHVIRTDGSRDNFSYKKCISGDHSSFTKFSIACRRTVDDELYNFKKNEFASHMDDNEEIPCAISNKRIRWDNAHVDHKAPMTFSVIVSTFISKEGIDISAVAYKTDGLFGNEFTDTSISEKFAAWHRANAMLRIIHARENFQRAFMGRVKPTKADRRLA